MWNRATRTPIVFVFLIVLPLGLVSACTTEVPATVTLKPNAPLRSNATIFLVAPEQRDRIVTSLVAAGLQVTDEWTGDTYSLTVKVGNNRTGHSCGAVNNVAYVLSRGERLAVIKGRGPTGSCEPNIFDDMSQKLASFKASG